MSRLLATTATYWSAGGGLLVPLAAACFGILF